MSLKNESANALHAYACRVAGTRLLAIRGSVSSPAEVPTADTLAIVSGEERLVLVGKGVDAFTGVSCHDVARLLETEGAYVEAGPVRFHLRGDLSAHRLGDATLMLKVVHRRSNGQLSGAVDRLILTSIWGAPL
jgi:hypothetical protein